MFAENVVSLSLDKKRGIQVTIVQMRINLAVDHLLKKRNCLDILTVFVMGLLLRNSDIPRHSTCINLLTTDYSYSHWFYAGTMRSR